MDINRDNLNTLFEAVSKAFADGFSESVETVWKEIATLYPMTTASVALPALKQFSGMREWLNGRQIDNVDVAKITVTPRHFEKTIGISRNDIEDDTYGIYQPIIKDMGAKAANLPMDLLEDAINNAASTNWMDGAAFFGTSRKYGKNIIANKGTSALSDASLKAAYDAMCAYKGDGDRKLKVRPNILVVGSSLRWLATRLVENPQTVVDGDAIPNELYGKLKLIVLDGMEGNNWILLDTRTSLKPIGYFERKSPNTIVRKDKAEDDNVFFGNNIIYGCDGRAECAWLFPHLAYLSVVA